MDSCGELTSEGVAIGSQGIYWTRAKALNLELFYETSPTKPNNLINSNTYNTYIFILVIKFIYQSDIID